MRISAVEFFPTGASPVVMTDTAPSATRVFFAAPQEQAGFIEVNGKRGTTQPLRVFESPDAAARSERQADDVTVFEVAVETLREEGERLYDAGHGWKVSRLPATALTPLRTETNP